MDSNQVDRIWFYEQPDGTLYPPDYLSDADLKFDNFEWNDSHRPKKMEDIFIWDVKIGPNSNKETKEKGKVEKIESEASENTKGDKIKETKENDKMNTGKKTK
jgi:hypothetical protein